MYVLPKAFEPPKVSFAKPAHIVHICEIFIVEILLSFDILIDIQIVVKYQCYDITSLSLLLMQIPFNDKYIFLTLNKISRIIN